MVKSARVISLEVCKKRRLETGLFLNLAQLDCKLNNTIHTTNTINIKDESGTYFWNKCVNKIDSNIEEERNDNHKNNSKSNKSRVVEVISSRVLKFKIKLNKEK